MSLSTLINPATALRTVVMNDAFGPSTSPLASAVAQLFASGAPGGAWDFADPAHLWQDAAGTLPAGMLDVVQRVDDLTGRGRHLLQPDLPKRPRRELLPNGMPALRFDGQDDFFTAAGLDLSATNEITVIAGVRRPNEQSGCIASTRTSDVPAAAGSFTLFARSGATDPNNGWGSCGDHGSPIYVLWTGSEVNAPQSAVLTGEGRIGGVGNSLSRIRGNGVVRTSSTTNQGAGTYTASQFYVGRILGAGYILNGYLTSLIIIGRLLTVDELTMAEAAVNAGLGAY